MNIENDTKLDNAVPRPPVVKKVGAPSSVMLTVALLVGVVGFILGTRANDIYATVAPILGVKISNDSLDLSEAEETYRVLKANYDGEVDKDAVRDGASRGIVDAAGDPYTVFMDAKEAAEFNNDLNGEVSGIGAEIGIRKGQPTILRVITDSPAEQSGVRAGDIIVAVNDESMYSKTSDVVASQIRGDVGTTVKVEVTRNTESRVFNIVRAKVTDPSVRSEVRDGIGILTISRFDTETASEARRVVESFKSQNVKGIVLDLRDNGGGYLQSAKGVASIWLNNKVVATEKTGNKVVDVVRTGNTAIAGDIKTVVLINGGSASASEIVAAALQEHGRASLVGEKTFGKGSVQKMINLPGGRILKVTVAKWYTPKDKNISEEGVTPGEKVELTVDDLDNGRDPQLEAAINKATE